MPVLRYYHVFNAAQCEGIEQAKRNDQPKPEFEPIQEAERIVAGHSDPFVVEHAGVKAFYSPLLDVVRLPQPSQFITREFYYATTFHELATPPGTAIA